MAYDLANFDVKKLFPSGISFKMGHPLTQFEQLLAVLPLHHTSSKPLMPKSYKSLLDTILAGKSELSEYYPHPNDVKIDPGEEGFNSTISPSKQSKRQYHYARMIMLIPFIDLEKLHRVVETNVQEMSDEEIDRNRIGKETEFKYDITCNLGKYESSLSMLPDIEDCHCKIVREQPFLVEHDQIISALPKQ
jgi:5'-3' exonuclease